MLNVKFKDASVIEQLKRIVTEDEEYEYLVFRIKEVKVGSG